MLQHPEEIENTAEWFAGILTPEDRVFISKLNEALAKSFQSGIRLRFGLSPIKGLTKNKAAQQMRRYLPKQALLYERVKEIWGAITEAEQDEIVEIIIEETDKIIKAEQPVELKKEKRFPDIFGKLR